LKRADGELIRLAKRHGPVVGAVEGLVYGEDALELMPDDLVFLYTDGVTEAMDPAGSLYDEDRLVEVLRSSNFATVDEAVHASTDDEFKGRPKGVADVARLRLEADNRLEEIDRINEGFESFAAEHGLPDRVRRSMKLVFDDLLNNVVTYAYDDDEVHVIEINVELSSDRLAVRIADDGHPFNPFAQSPPDTALVIEDREIGGLGIHLVQSLMDEVTYTRRTDRNVLVLVKYLSQGPTPEKESS
jgi:sigma-B regulation protein RsbU (phosphoserine phosphatase)